MKEFQIRDNEAGQRFDKYLSKLLRNAPKSFFYKMLRKKNITLNGKKATGNEKLEAGDQVKLFLSDETFDKFSQQDKAARAVTTLDVLYEDAYRFLLMYFVFVSFVVFSLFICISVFRLSIVSQISE